MISMLILVLLRETTGETFFYHYGKGNHTLHCNKSADRYRTVWYGGQDSSSLLKFELINCEKKSWSLQPCVGKPLEKASLCTERSVSIAAFPTGGIFACKTFMANETESKCPLFTDPGHCNTHDFFIIAIINSTAEQQVISVETNKPLESLSVGEKDNFTLSCKFSMKSGPTFVVYWIKDTDPGTCIFSVTNEGNHNFSYDANCCINATVKKRLVYKSTDSQEEQQKHDITILNAIPSDSGRYLCVFSAWLKKHEWKIVSNVSVEVRGAKSDSLEALMVGSLISIGVIVGIVLIGGITYFLFQKKKSKGNPSELQLERTPTTVELQEDECSPYAVSSRNDIEGNEAIYSLAGSPGVHPNGASSLPYGKTAFKMQPGENVQAIYARVNKQR